jgi:hypothetical protein
VETEAMRRVCGRATIASWEPDDPSVLTKGYQSVVTQVSVGMIIDGIAEFSPDHANAPQE